MPEEEKWFERLNPLNFAAIKLRTFYNDLHIGDATSFLIDGLVNGNPNRWMVTNWHVLAGRNAENPLATLTKNGAVPNHIKFRLPLQFNQSEYKVKERAGQLLFEELTFKMYDDSNRANWFQHKLQNKVDVAVIHLSDISDHRYKLVSMNDLSTANNMKIEIGSDVFIVGFPLGFSHFIEAPIWKKGSIASEPFLETPKSGGRVVIDATTRQGMSGSPVIMRCQTHYLSEDGSVKEFVNATRFIGIYSSRPNINVSSDLVTKIVELRSVFLQERLRSGHYQRRRAWAVVW